MDRINQIYIHPIYVENLEALLTDEANRIYCRHNMEHFLDVARIMTIMAYDAGVNAGSDSQLRELIYATALLHDIGRHMQYSEGIPHDEASVILATKIMTDCGFDEEEISSVCDAISAHRKPQSEVQGFLALLLNTADKKSRQCYSCKARNTCKWSSDKMNMEIEI